MMHAEPKHSADGEKHGVFFCKFTGAAADAGRYMENKTLRIFIKLYSILIAIIGFFSMMFFFPSPQGCTDVKVCLSYSLCGLAMLILSIGLFLLNDRARKCMVLFSFVFVGFLSLKRYG
jgi:hypothetical protein